MSETICFLNAFGMTPEEKSRRDQRIEQVVCMLRDLPARRKAFVAGDERNGITPVTLASRMAGNRICIAEWGFSAGNWDPRRFEKEIAESRVPRE